MIKDKHRALILCAAADLSTQPEHPDLVVELAGPILAWVSEAADQDDLAARMEAVMQARVNDSSRRPSDDPAGFVGRAEVLYRAIRGLATT